MTDEAKKLLSELRQFRNENDRLLSAIRTESTGLRTDLDAGFRHMDAGFRQMNDGLAVLVERVEVLQRQVTGMSGLLHRRRTLG